MVIGLRLPGLRRSIRKRILYASCFGIVFLLAYRVLPVAVVFPFDRDRTCEELNAREQLQQLCINYTKDIIGGNLCNDLCVSHHLILPECLAHKNTTIVFSGRWKDHEVVFKTKSKPSHMEKLENIMPTRYEVGTKPGKGWTKEEPHTIKVKPLYGTGISFTKKHISILDIPTPTPNKCIYSRSFC